MRHVARSAVSVAITDDSVVHSGVITGDSVVHSGVRTDDSVVHSGVRIVVSRGHLGLTAWHSGNECLFRDYAVLG